MSEDKEKFKRELLFIMWRWANESDITIGEWLSACHESIEIVLLKKNEEEK